MASQQVYGDLYQEFMPGLGPEGMSNSGNTSRQQHYAQSMPIAGNTYDGVPRELTQQLGEQVLELMNKSNQSGQNVTQNELQQMMSMLHDQFNTQTKPQQPREAQQTSLSSPPPAMSRGNVFSQPDNTQNQLAIKQQKSVIEQAIARGGVDLASTSQLRELHAQLSRLEAVQDQEVFDYGHGSQDRGGQFGADGTQLQSAKQMKDIIEMRLAAGNIDPGTATKYRDAYTSLSEHIYKYEGQYRGGFGGEQMVSPTASQFTGHTFGRNRPYDNYSEMMPVMSGGRQRQGRRQYREPPPLSAKRIGDRGMYGKGQYQAGRPNFPGQFPGRGVSNYGKFETQTSRGMQQQKRRASKRPMESGKQNYHKDLKRRRQDRSPAGKASQFKSPNTKKGGHGNQKASPRRNVQQKQTTATATATTDKPESVKGQQTGSENKKQTNTKIDCKLCEITVAGAVNYDSHTRGRRHMLAVELSESRRPVLEVMPSTIAEKLTVETFTVKHLKDAVFCAICEQRYASTKLICDHIIGQSHMHRRRQFTEILRRKDMRGGQDKSTSAKELWCFLCDTHINITQFKKHLTFGRHRKRQGGLLKGGAKFSGDKGPSKPNVEESVKEQTKSPDKSAETKSPDESAETKSPDESAETKSPDESTETKSPDESAETKSPDESAETKSPDKSADKQGEDESNTVTEESAQKEEKGSEPGDEGEKTPKQTGSKSDVKRVTEKPDFYVTHPVRKLLYKDQHKIIWNFLDGIDKLGKIIQDLGDPVKRTEAIQRVNVVKANIVMKTKPIEGSDQELDCAICDYEHPGSIGLEKHIGEYKHCIFEDVANLMVEIKDAVTNNEIDPIRRAAQRYRMNVRFKSNDDNRWFCFICETTFRIKKVYLQHNTTEVHNVKKTCAIIIHKSLKLLYEALKTGEKTEPEVKEGITEKEDSPTSEVMPKESCSSEADDVTGSHAGKEETIEPNQLTVESKQTNDEVVEVTEESKPEETEKMEVDVGPDSSQSEPNQSTIDQEQTKDGVTVTEERELTAAIEEVNIQPGQGSEDAPSGAIGEESKGKDEVKSETEKKESMEVDNIPEIGQTESDQSATKQEQSKDTGVIATEERELTEISETVNIQSGQGSEDVPSGVIGEEINVEDGDNLDEKTTNKEEQTWFVDKNPMKLELDDEKLDPMEVDDEKAEKMHGEEDGFSLGSEEVDSFIVMDEVGDKEDHDKAVSKDKAKFAEGYVAGKSTGNIYVSPGYFCLLCEEFYPDVDMSFKEHCTTNYHCQKFTEQKLLVKNIKGAKKYQSGGRQQTRGGQAGGGRQQTRGGQPGGGRPRNRGGQAGGGRQRNRGGQVGDGGLQNRGGQVGGRRQQNTGGQGGGGRWQNRGGQVGGGRGRGGKRQRQRVNAGKGPGNQGGNSYGPKGSKRGRRGNKNRGGQWRN
ncbi:uncharacterized protein LOC144437897 [Glandiceps talaboti]